MADACWARDERRTTRVAQTAPVGPAGARRSPSPMANAATGPDAQEQQGSSQRATEQADDCTATPSLVQASGSASRARPEMPHGQRVLVMASELLCYRPAPDCSTISSTALRSSSPVPVTPRLYPTRFDPNRP
ncbi:hypothetical protein D1007_03475 [Hordeum vulgare]|nr:hypothetical protein D1007_03475 [Hordeum vulgare]